MVQKVRDNLIRAIHASTQLSVLSVTGGGSGSISQLLQVPGASRTVLEAVVPYSEISLQHWLGGGANQACSAQTARAMAMASWMRARKLSPDVDPHQLVGVGATASLASDRPKRGDHRVHVATQTATETATHSLTLAKGQRDRLAEEMLATQLILLALAEACAIGAVEAQADLAQQLRESEQVTSLRQTAEPGWTDLLLGSCQVLCYPEPFEHQAVFPGAFNPLHTGHRRMAEVAAQRLGCPVAFELSITNVDKRPLDFVEIDARLRALQDLGEPTLLTDAPTFRAKAALFPGCTFIVGADTVARIADLRYYSGNTFGLEAAIQQLADLGCRFLVFGREIDGTFQGLSDLAVPPALRNLCDEVSAEQFRADISSTEIRDDLAS